MMVIRKATLAVGIIAPIAALSVIAIALATSVALADGNGEAVKALRGYVEQFDRIPAVSFAARVQVSLPSGDVAPDPGALQATQSGTYTYWAEGPKYRIDVAMGRKTGKAINDLTAFDGTKLYMLSGDFRNLTVSAGSRTRPTAASVLHNPMLCGLGFLSRDSDQTPFYVMQLSDILDQKRRQSVLAGARWTPGAAPNQGGFISISTGESRNGKPQSFRVYLDPPKDGMPARPRVEEEYSGDALFTRTTVSQFAKVETPAGAMALPGKIIVQGFEKGVVQGEIGFTIEKYDVPKGIDGRMFAIDYHDVESVFDADLGTFIQQQADPRAGDSPKKPDQGPKTQP